MSKNEQSEQHIVDATRPVYEAPEVVNHAVNQIVQGTGSNIQDGFANPGNLS